MLLLLILLAQGDGFQPVTPGNLLTYPGFEFTVPDGVFLAAEEDAQKMVPFTGAEFIPNLVGIFYSASGNQNMTVYVQHLTGTPFAFEPKFSQENWQDILNMNNLYTGLENTLPTEIISPPLLDEEGGSFSIGASIDYEDSETRIHMKKVWVNGPFSLVFALNASVDAFEAELDQIDAIFNSVTRAEIEPLDDTAEYDSYLRLLGFNELLNQIAEQQLGMQSQQAELEAAFERQRQEMEREQELSNRIAIGLGLGALVILAVAFVLKSRKSQ